MSQTAYILRVTIAVPEAHIADANQLALCLGESSADDQTFDSARYEDAEGNRYSVCSTVATHTFQTKAGTTLAAPEHAPAVDLAAAGRAQGMMVIASLEAPLPAAPNAMVALLGGRLDSAQDHLAALGLTAMITEE